MRSVYLLTSFTNNITKYSNTLFTLGFRRSFKIFSESRYFADHIKCVKNKHLITALNPTILLNRICPFTSKLSLNCWNCQNTTSSYEAFCSKCNSVQHLKECNHFERLNLELKFNVDLKELTRDFRKLQSVFHPDKFTLKSEVIYVKVIVHQIYFD